MSAVHPPMSLSVERRFVWYRLAKTGTRTLTRLLADVVPDYVYLERRHPIGPTHAELLASEPFSFTIVRNPWSRAWSAWSDKVAASERTPRSAERNARILSALVGNDVEARRAVAENFAAFLRVLASTGLYLRNLHFMPQTEILGDARLDHVGRFERYVDEVRYIAGRIGLPVDEQHIPHLNRSEGNGRYRDHFDDETVRIIADLYRADIDRWDYRFEDG